jgi:hypothetical protein
MYAQMVQSEASTDDPEKLAAFQARIDAGEKNQKTGCLWAIARP